MKVGQLRNVLAAASELYHEAGNARVAASLATFTKLLNENDDKSVTAFAKEKLREIYVAAGAATAAGDFEKLIGALNGQSSRPANDAIEGAKLPVIRVASSKRKQIDPAVASKYAEALLGAGTDQGAFNGVFEMLKSDRGIAKPQLDSIANRYLNEPSGGQFLFKFKSKTEALETIRRKFIERAQSESKRGIIERMTGWH